jgi:hypothetical protein
MKKKLLILGMLAMVFAVPAHAQLFMAWNACEGAPNASTQNMSFDCTPGSGFAAELWGTFGSNTSLTDVVAIDGIIDLAFQGQTDVPPFWHFETGGCNNTGIGYSLARGTSATPCPVANNSVIFCGTTGSGCGGGITAYINGSQVPLGGPNYARLLFTNARPATSPVDLPAMPTRIFCFHITLITDNTPGSGGADCAGCETPTALCWNQAVVFNNSAQGGGEGLAALIDSATPGSTGSIPANGATITAGEKKKSWGQLKALFR